MSVSIPKKGAEILRWAQEITRAHNRAVPIAGAGLRQRKTDAGTTLSLARAELGAMAVPFAVSVDDGNIVVRAGRHYWYDSTAEDYTVTTLDSSTTGWSGVSIPSASSSKYVYFTRERSTSASTATITASVGSSLATITALANDRTKVFVVALLTADSGGSVTIEQRLTEDQIDGPEAAGIPGGVIVMWSGTTPPAGWSLCDGTNGTPDLRGRFIVGYKSSDSDYDDPGSFSEGGVTPGKDGGFKWHGQTENNHNDHRLQHITKVEEGEEYVLGEHCLQDPPGSPVVTGIGAPACEDMWIVSSWCGGSSLPSYDVPGADHRAKHFGEWNGGADTDNRPPYYVLAFIMRDL